MCYGGGDLPTVTDAHAVLGHFGDLVKKRCLMADFFCTQSELAARWKKRRGSLSHGRRIRAGDSRRFKTRSSEEQAVRKKFPSNAAATLWDYTLVAFGGAGGLQACDLAAALEMRGVLLPKFPGALSALGILRADVVQDFSRTVLLPVENPPETQKLTDVLRKLQRDADHFLLREGFAKGQRRFEHRFDVRYVGQASDLSVPASGDFVAAFHRAHELAYGHADADRPIEE